MISTKNYAKLPDRVALEKTCKAISVLDAVLCQEWEFRYYSFNSNWGEGERVLQMRDGQGDEMHILFRDDGCMINGFAGECGAGEIEKLTFNLPHIFHEFAFGEPVKSIGTTFCLWTTDAKNWQAGKIESGEDFSGNILSILDGNPQTYIDWAQDYFGEACKEGRLPIDTVTKIYSGETLTKEMVLSLAGELEDWHQLEEDLKEIGYPYDFR
ncbi:MAG: hypothetical protein FWG66_02215 [Spirochaetes bacterium]|nr:hypothetical protein [Spirochaetota bacterium]